MSEQKPQAVWVFPEPTKRRGGRIALVALLVVLVLIVTAVVALFLVPRDDPAVSTPSPTTTGAAKPSASPSTSAPASPSAPPTTPPPPADPDIAAFRDQVDFHLSTASQGLDLIAQGDDPQGTVSKLHGDAQRLADVAPPASIEQDWRAALQDYMTALDGLSQNPADPVPLENARSAVNVLTTLLRV